MEVVLGLGSVIAVSWWLPTSWRPSHIVFCALFIVVFAVAVRSRTRVAYSASLFSAISYGMLLWLRPELRAQPDFFYLALEPFLLLVCGVCVSDLLRWQRHRLAGLEQQNISADELLQQVQECYQSVLTINETLEREVAEQPTSIATLSEKLARLWELGGSEHSLAIVDVIISTLEAQSCAVYRQRDDAFYLDAEQSMENSIYGSVLQTDDPLIKRVIQQCMVCTIRDVLAEERSAEPAVAVMAGPLLNQEGKLVGVVRIDSIPLFRFTPGMVRLLSALLQIASISLQTIEYVHVEGKHISVEPSI